MQDRLPGPVRWARILMFVIAGLAFASAAVVFVQNGPAAALDALVFAAPSGAAQLLLGLLVRRRGPAVFTAVLIVQAVSIASTLLSPSPAASLTQLLLPAVVVGLALSRTSRDYFLRS
ncbi:hypothetical protein [Actinorugispora endophytica]|uniref:Uncharacterized protein n=1 Tax=Actinorugispora endophytica TaxID=1605990 RepID=A0A4R6UY31_9ACTN|nr:hypothetical protein [Actinorugispora endophytica]TDQ52200.1 hypothetical protein EV190_10730 [Actinorugispora endophytica]